MIKALGNGQVFFHPHFTDQHSGTNSKKIDSAQVRKLLNSAFVDVLQGESITDWMSSAALWVCSVS